MKMKQTLRWGNCVYNTVYDPKSNFTPVSLISIYVFLSHNLLQQVFVLSQFHHKMFLQISRMLLLNIHSYKQNKALLRDDTIHLLLSGVQNNSDDGYVNPVDSSVIFTFCNNHYSYSVHNFCCIDRQFQMFVASLNSSATILSDWYFFHDNLDINDIFAGKIHKQYYLTKTNNITSYTNWN